MNTTGWDDEYHQMTRREYLDLLADRRQQLDHDHAAGHFTDRDHAYLRAHAAQLSPIALREQVDHWHRAGSLDDWSDAATWTPAQVDETDQPDQHHRETGRASGHAAAQAAAHLTRAAVAHRWATTGAEQADETPETHHRWRHEPANAHTGVADER